MARILVVDDEPDMRMALGNVLSKAGHEVAEAGDGPGALEHMASRGADLMLLDMRLPGMDGPQILRALRERDKKTPVVMVTGYGSVESAVEVMRLGASHYLSKPFSNQELVETVERVLAGGRMPMPSPARAMPLMPTGPVTAHAEPAGGLLRWGALAAACAAAAALFLATRGGGASGADFAIAHDHTTALVWRGERLFAADWVAQTVYEYKLAGDRLEPVRSVRLPDSSVTALAVSADRIYLADASRHVIEERKLDDAMTLVRSEPSPGSAPSGLYWDGKYLWSSDSANGRIYRHSTEAGLAVLESFKGPARSPAALHRDEGFLWSADSETRRLYRHRLDKSLSVLAVYSLVELDRGSQPLSALAIRGKDVWFARDGTARVYRRPMAAFVERPQGG